MRAPFEIGREVVAKAGRDKGKRFIVVDMPEEEYVLICDGDSRKLAKPKRKKRMHVRTTQYLHESVLQKMQGREQLLDSDIRKALDSTHMEEV